MVVDCHFKMLHEEFGYPRLANSDHSTVMNNSVWDILNGTLLKVGENGEVLRALLGSEVLTRAQIKEIYPNGYENPGWPHTHRSNEHERPFWQLMTFFDCSRIPVIVKMTDLIR